MALPRPSRSFRGSNLEQAVGFAAASLFSVAYVAAPLHVVVALLCLLRAPLWWVSWLLSLPPPGKARKV